MKTSNTNSIKKKLGVKLSRLSVVGISAFIMVIIFVVFIVLTISETEDFAYTLDTMDLEQSWTRGEYKKIYSYFLNEMNRLKYWQAYQNALKLKELDKEQLISSDDNKLLIDVVAQAVPAEFKDYAEGKIGFDILIQRIKKRYLTYYPNKEQAEEYLKYGKVENSMLRNVPKVVLASGFEAEVAAEKIDFRDYVEFLKLRMSSDLKKSEIQAISKHIENNFYSFRQFLSRSMLRNFGRRILKLPEKYTFAEKERRMTLQEKTEALQILFAFIRDNVSVVKPDKAYITAYPLDTLFRGYGDIESVNYLYSDMISAVLDINSFEISFPDSNARPLICILFDDENEQHVVYGFDFVNRIPLINDQDELLDLIALCKSDQVENSIISEHCDYIDNIKEGGDFHPRFFANMFQLEPRIALYLNNDIGLDVRPLPTYEDLYKNEVLIQNSFESKNVDDLVRILSDWGEMKLSSLGQRLFVMTDKPNLSRYFDILTSNKFASLNLNTRKIAFIFEWTEDASTEFSNGETDYLTSEHSDRYIRDYNMLMFNNVDSVTGMIPFEGTGMLFALTLIENYRQFKFSAIQSLYQSGLLYMNQGKFQKAAVCFSDFLTKCEHEDELYLDAETYPGVLIEYARFLVAKCNYLSGDIDGSQSILEKMIAENQQPAVSKTALRYGFGKICRNNTQTQNNK